MPGERHLLRIIFKNFIDSLRPRQIRGNHVGSDYIGNKYFEIPPNPSIGKRKAERWYDPPTGLDFQDPIPSEWESWLRMRRTEPPTKEEVQGNLAIAQMKKENAAKLEAQRFAERGDLPAVPVKGPLSFPKYEDLCPGDPENHPSRRNR